MEITPRLIEQAAERGEMHFDYQPKVSFLTGEVCGAEALLRWRRDDGSEVSPESFVLRVLHSAKSAVLVKLSIAMAQMLGIRTVVEGVESKAIYDSLLHSGCSAAQGFWVSRPLPLEDYLHFLNDDPRWPASPIGLFRMAQLTHYWQERLLIDMVFAALRSDDPVNEIPLDFHLDETECELGKWYYGFGERFVGDPDFDALEAPHRAMHDLCNEVFSALRTGDRRRILDELLNEISANSCRVTACLNRLETKALIEEAR